MNAYSEFSDKELDGQIAAISMHHFNMTNYDGKYKLYADS